MSEHIEKFEPEGIVAKRASSIYVRGRCKDWLKIKTPAGKAREARGWNIASDGSALHAALLRMEPAEKKLSK